MVVASAEVLPLLRHNYPAIPCIAQGEAIRPHGTFDCVATTADAFRVTVRTEGVVVEALERPSAIGPDMVAV